MMNQIMKPQQMQQMGGAGMPELTEEELRKLAMLLQQMPENEGLASINQNEAELMKNYGGSGTPLPGTQGLGPEGGPVRSYDTTAAGQYSKPKPSTAAGQSSSVKASTNVDQPNVDQPKLKLGGSDWSTFAPIEYLKQEGIIKPMTGDADRGDFETRMDVIAERDRAEVRGGVDPQSGDSQTGPDATTAAVAQTFKDVNGTEFNTPAEANASNAQIQAGVKGIEGQALKSDSTYERWAARNKDNPQFAGLSDEQKQAAYQTALTKSQESASAQVPQMVELMNKHFAEGKDQYGVHIGDKATFDDFKRAMGGGLPANLSEATMREMYETARTKYQRGEAFTLTPEEVAKFERDAIQTASVDDADRVELGKVADATVTEVDEVADVTPTEVAAIASVTDADVDAIFEGGTDKAEALLLARIDGTADSPAERQLMRSSEQNLRMLLGATAGGDADPSKVRQLKNVWQDMTQVAIGEAADLRSRESLDAEAKLVELYRGRDTMKLNTKLANMEKEKQKALKNGDLALAGKLANQGTMLQRVITKASLETNTKLANLEKAKTMAIEQGKTDLATNIANLQKNLTIATTDAKLAAESRAMDDALAMNAYKGEQALYGLEAQIDTENMKAELTQMGFDLQRDLAELDSATQLEVANLTKEWREAQGDDAKQAAIIGAIGTVLAGFAKSDIRAKTNIAPGSGEVESFLDALNSYKYEYKDPSASDETGMFIGVMAQDLEKTPMGASFVKDTPKGKMVDYGHGLAAILASQANIHDRLRHLEEG